MKDDFKKFLDVFFIFFGVIIVSFFGLKSFVVLIVKGVLAEGYEEIFWGGQFWGGLFVVGLVMVMIRVFWVFFIEQIVKRIVCFEIILVEIYRVGYRYLIK